MMLEDIINNLDLIYDFCQSIPDESERNSVFTLINMCRQKIKDHCLEEIEIV